MDVLKRRPVPRPLPSARWRPVVIDCIGRFDVAFADVLRNVIGTIEIDRPVLVELKRATVDDIAGIVALAETIRTRRESGGYAAILAHSKTWNRVFERYDIPVDFLVTSADPRERRRIILAERARVRHFSPALLECDVNVRLR